MAFGIRLINKRSLRLRDFCHSKQGQSAPFKMSSYHLALVDLELSTNSELFSYIKSIFEPQLIPSTGTRGDARISSTEKGKKTKKRSSDLKRIYEGKVKDLSESVSRRSFYSLESLREGSQRGTLSTALCSHLPLCRRIFYKHRGGTTRPRESCSDEDWENDNEDGPPLERIDRKVWQPLPLGQIVGKINIDEPEDFQRGRKLPKLPAGVREFSSSVSNPLYKDYNPVGYVKSEDELAREFIRDICQRFNVRMKSCFDGEPIQLDPLHMIRILRDNLEKA